MIEKHLEILGLKVRDKVTGVVGIVTSVAFDLFGCVQAVVKPPAYVDKDGKTVGVEGFWFDTNRLLVLDSTPVMPVPSYGEPVEGMRPKSFAVPGGSEQLPSPTR